ncbi:MAG: cell division protein FtsA [Clostridia bacterium]|nr:cell division protein FtsA [Clostridia bacterium]
MAIGDIIVGLDIGVSKVSCVIGQVNKFSEIEVIGYGLSNNSGIKRGQILDYERVGQSIKDAVNSAEQISELSVNSSYVNIKGMNVRIEKVVMESEVERPNDGMTVNDIYNLYTKIQISTRLERDEQIIDILPLAYFVNGRVYKDEPIGAFCKTFQMEVEVVIARGDYIDGIQKALKYADLKIDGLILETLATSNIILMPEEKQSGVLMLDIGGGHTDISVYKNDRLEFYTTLPVGGDHITNDISMTFNISTDEAEKLKRQYNLALVSMITNNHEIKLTSKADASNDIIKCSEIVQVIEARIKEVYQLVRRMLQEKGMITGIGSVVLTGQGISNIVGAEELAKRVLKINNVRICSPKLINVIKPQHTTVYGMVRYISGLGLSKHVNSDVQIVTEPTFKDKIFEGLENLKDKIFFKSKNK